MSAWARLVRWDESDEFLELCSAALLEVQREHAHKLAEKQRKHHGPEGPGGGCHLGACCGDELADLIDPEVSSE